MKRQTYKSLGLLAGILLFLLIAGGLWVRSEQRQYMRNRQLIAALVHNDTRQALELINAGADPNTQQHTSPAPNFKGLLHQLLCHSSPDTEDSPTALMLACGEQGDTKEHVAVSEDIALVTAMLKHGANATMAGHQYRTPLLDALYYRSGVTTLQLLLQYGANVNAPDGDGNMPLMLAAFYGYEEKVEFLATHDARLNAQNR